VLECLPLEYMGVVSQVKCLLLTVSLSTLLAVNHSSAHLSTAVADAGRGAGDLVAVLEQSLRLLRLSLTDSRTVHPLHSAGLLHCFSALHCRIATQVHSSLYVCRCMQLVCLCDATSVTLEKRDSFIANKLHHAQNFEHIWLQTEKFWKYFIP